MNTLPTERNDPERERHARERLDRDKLDRDLGMGSRVANRRGSRFLNQDGSFNVRRRGQGLLESLNVFHWLLTMSGTQFLLLISGGYVLTNLVFAIGYYLCGPKSFSGNVGINPGERFMDGFFFSVQTLATIGYGRISPQSLPANILVTIESLVGLMGFAIVTGIVFSRFSR